MLIVLNWIPFERCSTARLASIFACSTLGTEVCFEENVTVLMSTTERMLIRITKITSMTKSSLLTAPGSSTVVIGTAPLHNHRETASGMASPHTGDTRPTSVLC
jgi:hypothetical protein